MGMSVLALPRPAEPVRRRALWLSRLVRRRATVVGLVLLAVTTLVGVLAPVIAGDPLRMEVSARLTAPGAAHWFGTDDVGRDVWSRVVYGARLSLLVGAAVVLLAFAVGLVCGLAAGYWRRLDNPVMRVMDGLMAFPAIILAIALMASLGPSVTNVIVAIGVVYAPRVARIVRGSVLVIRETTYVEAARALGVSDVVIVTRHVYRPTVMGRRGVVTSAHPLASMAGIEILLAGGNAVDAAVAVGSTLNVVEPFMSSAAGIGLMLISRGGERHVLDFIGRAPRAADAARCTEDELAGGPKSCATPGNLGGWLAALERFGTMDRARVLAPAIGHAERGVPLTFKNVEFFEAARATLGRSREAERLYLGNGGPRAGGVVTYRELASTFRQVAEGGAEVFYRGPVGQAIARVVR